MRNTPPAGQPNPYTVHDSGSSSELPTSYVRLEAGIKTVVAVAALLLAVCVFALLAPFSELVAITGVIVILFGILALDFLSTRTCLVARLIAAVSSNPDARYHLGVQRYWRGQRIRAYGDFEEVVRNDPDHAFAWASLGGIAFEQGNFQDCIARCDRAIELDPDLEEPRLSRSFAYHETGQPEAAIRDLDAALWSHPESTRARHARSMLRMAAGNLDGALEDIEAALREDSKDMPSWALYIQLLTELGRLEDAYQVGKQATAMEPKNLDVTVATSDVALRLGKSDESLRLAERAVRIGENDARGWVLRGAVQSDRGAFAKAIRDFDIALKIEPENAAVLGQRGLAKHFSGRSGEGLADLDRAVQLLPEQTPDVVIYNNRGFVRNALGQQSGAEEDFRRAIEIDPEHPNAYKNWAWQLATSNEERFRDGDRAVTLATKAMELTDWKSTEWLPILAAAYAARGDFQEAIRLQEESNDASTMDRLNDYRRGNALRV